MLEEIELTVLVTGGAGYIGSHTCVELLNAGFDIVVVDNLSNSHPEALKRVSEITNKNFSSYFIDLMDRESLDYVFKEHQIDAVIHFAGLKAVGESVQFPLKYYHENLMSTMTLCEVMESNGVRQLIFSSSATVYGVPKQVPIDENAPIGAINPYGRTKQMIEQMLHDLVLSNSNWSVVILRYFNPVGAHSSGRIGEDPSGLPNNLVPYISQVAVGKLSEVNVYGNDYDTLDGTGVRDYIHVVDLALGHLKALIKVEQTTGVSIYNLGNGRGYSVLEMIKSFQEASGRSIPYRIADRRSGDIAICYAETTKANTELQWVAEKGIEEMCSDTWRWQSMNPNGYKELVAFGQKG